MGDYDRKMNQTLPTIKRKAAKVITHPNFTIYKATTEGFDIALVKLDERVPFDHHIQPICFPEKGEDEDIVGKMATLTGWGRVFEDEAFSQILQQVFIVPKCFYRN